MANLNNNHSQPSLKQESFAATKEEKITPDASQLANSSDFNNLASLLEKQLAKSDQILMEVELVKQQIRWQKIWGAVRFLVIVLPIILGLIYGLLYLPPEIKKFLDYYSSLLQS